MKLLTLFKPFLTTLAALALALGSQAAFGQGSLIPPGPPSPMMKTLQQVEPRTDVLTLSGDSSALYIIAAPGSYYLTTNIAGASGLHGISITTNDVVLDLSGFSVLGVSGSYSGIVIGSVTNVVVRNGSVTGWDYYGIVAYNAHSSRFEQLQLSRNSYGLAGGPRSTITGCLASLNRGDGFNGGDDTFTSCTSSGNGGSGFNTGSGCSFFNCTANANTNHGIYPLNDCVMQGCVANGNGWDGFWSQYVGCVVKDCLANNNVGNGISIATRCVAQNNSCSGNGAYGILAARDQNRIDSNLVTSNKKIGVKINGSGNLIVRNQANKNAVDGWGNSVNYSIPAPNKYGRIVEDHGEISSGSGWENFSDPYIIIIQ